VSNERSRLAVLGSPIHHSKSPAIQRAAYDVLGVDWSYEAIEITGADLPAFIETCGPQWRGLSLTMPLKRDILPLLTSRLPLVDTVGGANTVLFTGDGIHGFNTDVMGVVRSFENAGISSLDYVHVLGAGATAASVLAGVAQLGATRVLVSARSPEKATGLVAIGESLGVDVTVRAWGVLDKSLIAPDAIVSTLPGGQNDLAFAAPIRERSALFDIAYDPWPSELANAWYEAGGTVISGYELLIQQAVGQVRVFTSGNPDHVLPNEAAVVAAMRAAIA
jgi:shikimate dehydrogenase